MRYVVDIEFDETTRLSIPADSPDTAYRLAPKEVEASPDSYSWSEPDISGVTICTTTEMEVDSHAA